MPGTANSPEVQAELNQYAKQHKELLDKQAQQESVVRRLTAKPQPLSSEDQQTLAAAQSQLVINSGEMSGLVLKESAAVSKIDPATLAAASSRQALINTIIVKDVLPKPGKVSLVHPSLDPADLVSYMLYTQHLNPYGRQRQCDIDLQNAIALINGDVNASVGVYIEVGKSLVTGAIGGIK